MKGSNTMTMTELASVAALLRMGNQKIGRPDETLGQLADRLTVAVGTAEEDESAELEEYLCAVESAASELGTFNHKVEDAAFIIELRAGKGKPTEIAFASVAAFVVPIAMLAVFR